MPRKHSTPSPRAVDTGETMSSDLPCLSILPERIASTLSPSFFAIAAFPSLFFFFLLSRSPLKTSYDVA